MSSHRPDPRKIEELRAQVVRNVETYGVHIQAVFGDAKTPSFAYSVGLWRRNQHPEIVLVGLSPQDMHGVLNDVANVVRAGEPLVPGQRYSQFFEGFDTIFRPVKPRHREQRLKAANWFNAPAEYPALQMVWPDPSGVFPWEAGYDVAMRRIQLEFF
jgi:hypothetical protein